MWYKYKDGERQYNWHEDNRDFRKIMKDYHFHELQPFRAGMYGLWDPLFDADMIIVVIVTISIIDIIITIITIIICTAIIIDIICFVLSA